MKKHPSWHLIVGILAFLIALIASVSLAHFFVTTILDKLGRPVSDYTRMIITSLLGSFLFCLIPLAIGQAIRPRQIDYINSLIEAFRRIAKGDFSVSIDLAKGRPDGQFAELTESINQMTSELGEMEKTRQEFVSNVSHEIQSPLTSIGGFARALQDDNLDPQERLQYLQIIEAESRRVSKISDNLLKLTMLESERHPFERKSYRLDRQLTNLILVCEPQWMAKGIQMEAELEKVTFTADEDLMSQVWTNLLQNSIKFTPEGGKITVRLRKKTAEIECQICDSGIGIKEEDLPHIFERFYKVDKSRNPTNSGSGLGLSLVKKIIELHKGTVKVQSGDNRGTQFIVILPDEADAHLHKV
ncbi:MAG: HAMP domain-containing histidine kinase [Gorillibacterium sp.]|nr:HAMP domain-containing histidine kinase [Gorillibacterium sp.]